MHINLANVLDLASRELNNILALQKSVGVCFVKTKCSVAELPYCIWIGIRFAKGE